MKYPSHLLFVLLMAIACGEEDPGDCVVEQTILRNGDEIVSKNVYVHDGVNYTEVRKYRFNQNTKEFEDQPNEVGTFTYNDGRISTVRYTYPGPSPTYREYGYSYTGENKVFVDEHFTEVSDGNIITDRVTKLLYVDSAEDGYYTFENEFNKVIEEFKDGNLVRLGFEDPEGEVEAFGTRWNFQVSYKYDNNPNVARDFPLGREIFVLNFGFNRNNMIEETYSYDNLTFSKKQSFAFFGNGRLNKWTFLDTGMNITFEYGCK